MSERRRIIEGTWTCASCGAREVLGRHKTCPSCGNPRDSASEMSFDFGARSASGASNRETVTDADALAAAEAGADWFCAFCRSGNRGDTQVCRACGSPRDERALVPEVAAPPVAAAAAPPAPASVLSKVGTAKRGCGCGCGTLLVGLLILLGAFLALGYWGSRTHEVEARVVERHWTRTSEREVFARVTREGWQSELKTRRSVMPVAGRGEVAGVEGIRDCARRQRSTRRVATGTRQVCDDRTRQVQCGTDERCETRDRGNGFAEEVCRDVPRYCSESYRDCRDETVYREEPVYDVMCRYDSWEWRAAGQLQERGGEEPPRWPARALASQERETRKEAYEIVFEYQGKGARRHTWKLSTPEEYARWPRGTAARLTVNNVGDVKAVRPAGP
jgi:hypothetical protein